MAKREIKLDSQGKPIWLSAQHAVSCWGRVIDSVTQIPIADAEVTLIEMPAKFAQRFKIPGNMQRPGQTRSRADGLFYFLDLPEGRYTVGAKLPGCGKRYGEVSEEFRVPAALADDNVKEALKKKFVGLALEPTAIRGRVVDAATKIGVKMAEIRVKGTNERTFSDARGGFTIGPIEASKKSERILECFAQGYKPREKDAIFVATPGKLMELEDDVDLEPTARH